MTSHKFASLKGFSLLNSLIAVAIAGVALTGIVKFASTSQKQNATLVADLEVEAFKSRLLNVLASKTLGQEIFKVSATQPLKFEVPSSGLGVLASPIEIPRLELKGQVFTPGSGPGAELGRGLRLRSAAITEAHFDTTIDYQAVRYKRFLASIELQFERDRDRSVGPQRFVHEITLPMLVRDSAPFEISYVGDAATGNLEGTVLEPLKGGLRLEDAGPLGATCAPGGGPQPPYEVKIAGSEYTFCGFTGKFIDPLRDDSNMTVDQYRYEIEKRADGFYVIYQAHIWTEASSSGDIDSFGSCDTPPETFRLWYTCFK